MDKLTEARYAKLAKIQERTEAAGFTIERGDVFWVKGTTDALIDGMPSDQWLDAMCSE